MTSMFDSIRSLITPAAVSRAAAQTGESEAGISRGFDAAVPAILGTLTQRSDDRGFMSQLSSLASSVPADSDPLSYAKSFGPPPASGIDASSTTGGWLSSLFGRNLSGVTDGIGRYAGLKSTSSGALLSMAAPLVIGYLGRMMRTDNLDATGLANRLRGERRHLASSLPPGFDVPGLARTPMEATTATTYHEPVRRAEARAARHEPSGGGWALPLVLGALALAGLLWWASRDRTDEPARARVEEAETAVGTTGRVTEPRTDPRAADGYVSRTLPGNINLRVPQGGLEDRLVGYLGSPTSARGTFELDRINFETGSAVLTPQSREQIQNIAQILRAYPDAHVVITGHTDNVGDEAANMALSQARAESVGASLRDAGITAIRIDAKGAGSREPVADNTTEAGRERNRRVTLEVTAR